MNVKTQDMEMAVEACWYNNQLYVPFLDLARAFRKQAMVTSGGLGVPSDFAIKIDSERYDERGCLLSKLFEL